MECKEKVLLQFPEGLKQYAYEYAKNLERKGICVFLSARPSYGACDLAYWEAKIVGASKIIHFGHAEFPFNGIKHMFNDIKVEYVVWREKIEEESIKILGKKLLNLGIKKVGLISTVQYTKNMSMASKVLSDMGITVILEKGNLGKEKGQILGCDPSAALKEIKKGAEGIVFIGNGNFHPNALAMIDINVPFYSFNPKNNKLNNLGEHIEKVKKRRKGIMLSAIDAKTFGILVSVKNGQYHLDIAESIKQKLEKLGKQAFIIVGDELSPLSISNYTFIDAFITTACPRIVDDTQTYSKPVLDLIMFNKLVELLNELK